ncbi:MAG: glycosyltransferase family 39 protein [Candidatus Eisenbacteria bacterium]|uniref:Glycosyltransferase family 39 protein n=1 Tax=Eiseniibacteriota bacterium TaxID=2212470 RepID=A0A948RXS6_UNCEI|nr:glycosyltransferase family 39 protein [Candidatus Eisenbacteria bacterium]MBU1950177.1 glycosyltransferase family 39 protein [Candidatus Eisenbacteria bacterium]MBU2692805.1 glycosyltransferase family 39 protein [Candidatus Eisenbacteria bacterium]
MRKDPRTLLVAAIVFNIIVVFVLLPAVKDLYPYINIDTFPDHYEKLAMNLAEGNGYRFYAETSATMGRTPGYPLILALVFLLTGKSLFAAKLINLLFAVATAYMIRILVRGFSHSKLVMYLTPLFFLLHPATLLAETRGGPEIVLAFSITLSLNLLYHAIRTGRGRDHFLTGLALGVSTLIKSTTLLFPFAWLVFSPLFRKAGLKRACRGALLMILGLSAVLSPWIIRNARVSGKFVPTMTVVGMSASQGLAICKNAVLLKPWTEGNYTGRGMNEAAYAGLQEAAKLGYKCKGRYFIFFYSTHDEIEFNAHLLDQVIDEYKRSPLLLLKCLWVNLFNFWFAGVTILATLINMLIQTPLMVFAAIGAVRYIKSARSELVMPLVLFIGYYVAVHIPILAIARHSLPLIPILAVLASGLLEHFQSKFS